MATLRSGMIVTSKSFSLSDVHYPAIHSHNADVEKFHGVILCDRCQCHPHSNSDCNQLAFCRRFLCSCGFNILITNVHERTPLSPNNAPCEPSSTPYLLFRTTALTTCQGWCHSLTKKWETSRNDNTIQQWLNLQPSCASPLISEIIEAYVTYLCEYTTVWGGK